jgi:hypothetical protein
LARVITIGKLQDIDDRVWEGTKVITEWSVDTERKETRCSVIV